MIKHCWLDILSNKKKCIVTTNLCVKNLKQTHFKYNSFNPNIDLAYT